MRPSVYTQVSTFCPFQINTTNTFAVLNDRLTGRDYLVGPGKGTYGIADINAFPWVRIWRWAGVESLGDFPNVEVSSVLCAFVKVMS